MKTDHIKRVIILFYCLLTSIWVKSVLTQKYRLSKDIIPDMYDIHIKPYLQPEDGDKQFTFDGQVNITLHSVVNNVREITLHKSLINITNATLYDPDGTVQQINSESMYYDSNIDKLQLNLVTTLVVDKNYTLYFAYHGLIRNGMQGFYRATNDNVKWYGITQLHRIDARTVFPCFDEPDFKAKFRMRISRTTDYKSFFNTRRIKSSSDGDRFIDYFEETPLMSTYLIAFLVSDFMSKGNEDLKIIMDAKFINKTNFALEVGQKALNVIGHYTRLPYKSLGNEIMQMVGTDHFPHSGMENWGLVLYKEGTLAEEPGYTNGLTHKVNTISLVVHETAHMWFGNSVTHKWWSYFWLNEGFANYYQYFISQKLYPEYEFDQQFAVNELQAIFDFDATGDTQPLTSPENSINTPLEIASKFSNIAYAKGAAIIRMFSNLMGQENFDMAIRAYLKENHLKTTEPSDLFKQLKKYWPSNHIVDLNEFFKDWTEQVGYPMVNVSVNPSGRFSVKQQRFLLDPYDGSNASLKYTIPITFYSNKINNIANLTVPKLYLNKEQNERLFDNVSHHKWIVVNQQQFNYYRVFYDSELLKKLQNAFKLNNHSGIHVINRASIVDDLFTYGLSGLKGYDEVLDFMEYLATEMDYLPWQAAFKGFETIYQRLTMAQHNKFADYLFDILEKVFEKLGLENNTNNILDILNRNNVIGWLCKYHHENCNEQVRALFNSYYSSNIQPSADFRETLYCAAVRNDNFLIYEKLKEMFLDQQLASEKEKILRAMACTRYFVQQHYEFILTNNVSQVLKTKALKNSYSQTPENIMPVFNLIMENTQQLAEVLQDWSTTANAFKDIAQYFTTTEQLTALIQFNKSHAHLFGNSSSILESSIEIVQKNLKWSAERLPKLMEYLNERNIVYHLNTNIIPSRYDIHLKGPFAW